MQTNNDQNTDKEKLLANQQDTINNVKGWLREEGLEPQEITHLRKDARYYGVIISNEGEEREQRENQRRKAFHVLFPIDRRDSLRISELIILDLLTQKTYASLAAKMHGVLEQNRFYSELELALLQMNVSFIIKKNMRELKSIEISKVIYSDALTKDTLFDNINLVHNSIEFARIKTGQLRDSAFVL